MDRVQAINALATLNACASRMLVVLARDLPLRSEDKGQIQMFPRLALALLIACDGRPGPLEKKLCGLDATAALVEVTKKSTEILSSCAQYSADYALATHKKNTHTLHLLTLELCSALRLEPL